MIPYGQKDFPHQVRPQADPYDIHKELTAMKILPACAADTAKIYRIMTEARSLAPDPGWYCTDSEEYIRSHIVNPDEGIVFKAVEHDCLAAFFIIHFPGNTPDSLGHYMNLDPWRGSPPYFFVVVTIRYPSLRKLPRLYRLSGWTVPIRWQ